jgi:hypothetical protein
MIEPEDEAIRAEPERDAPPLSALGMLREIVH